MVDVLNPFSHPTTVVAVDDDPTFLEGLSFQMARYQPCQSFTDPRVALAEIRANLARTRVADTLVVPIPPEELNEISAALDDSALRLRSSHMVDIAGDSRRAEEVSTVLVDYDMPVMDGLSFCRALRDVPVQKILLTGKADANTAVAAFNEGLIQHFLFKSDQDIHSALRSALVAAQTRYFQYRTQTIRQLLDPDRRMFADPALARHVRAVMDEHRIIEHYTLTDPPGLLCLDADGAGFILLIQDQDQVADCIAIAAEEGVPAAMLAAMRAPGVQPWLSDGHPRSSPCAWDLHPAVLVAGLRDWRLSRLPIPGSLTRQLRPLRPGRRFPVRFNDRSAATV
ncbi:MAG: hypothetical protein RLY86_448 [Pseudomonadota bacterium]|jgi:CheY-like chemotaxis protein